jgi:hypothetical protein
VAGAEKAGADRGPTTKVNPRPGRRGILGACKARRSKQEILQLTDGAKTAAELEKILGKPDQFEAFAMLEHWIYVARDGRVTFHVAAGRIVFRETLEPREPGGP